MKSVPLAHLVEDTQVYPRHTVDAVHVGQLVQALRAGALLPPVVAEAKTLRLVDGWHRVRAYHRFLGPTGVISVETRTYASEADLLMDAIRLNSAHGRRLDRVDQVRAILLAEHAGAVTEQIALAMHLPIERIERLRVRVAEAPSGNGLSDGVVVQIALKRPMIHFAGRELTEEQAKAHESMGGTSFLLQVWQIREALRLDLMNRADERLMAALAELSDELTRYLGAVPVGSGRRG